MSIEDKPLPDFSQNDNSFPVVPAKHRGIPKAPVPAPASAFSVIESEEVSRTLDFGMSEEDMLDDSDGEGSSSELHDSLRALHDQPGAVEDDFTSLASDYESNLREEDTYRKPVSEFELPALDDSSPLIVDNDLSLPDFSKFDEVEEVVTPTPIENVEEPEAKSRISPKMVFIFIGALIVAVIAFIVVAFVIPGSTTPGVIMAPGAIQPLSQVSNLLQ